MKKESRSAHLFNFEDLQGEAENYLEAVRLKARGILANALAEAQKQKNEILEDAEKIREKAQKEGFLEGLRQGEEKAEEKIREKVEVRVQVEAKEAISSAENGMRRLLTQCSSLKEELTQNWESAFLHLISRIAKVVIRRELKNDPQITMQWIREMFELSSSESSLVLHLNPEDATLLKSSLERLSGEFRLLGKLEVKANPALERGDCILKSENGQLDQRLDVQLARIEEELRA